MHRGLFVTGTDTGVGKTLVAVALIRSLTREGWRVNGMKPIASGSQQTVNGLRNEDALALQSASSEAAPYEWVNPYVFEPAIAPHIAAQRAGTTIDLDRLIAAYNQLASRADITVVEGAGGWCTPLDHHVSLRNFPEALRLDVILVVGLRLGCLNHALLTTEAIQRNARCRVIGWVGNSVDASFSHPEDNIDTLRAMLATPCLGIIPNFPGDVAIEAEPYLELATLRESLKTR